LNKHLFVDFRKIELGIFFKFHPVYLAIILNMQNYKK
jgi:hypothetical protein